MSREIYDKVYFNDNYSAQLGELRERYQARTADALSRRSVEEAPMPNATTVVFMHDESDGGVTITTGDFVNYFNQKSGKDRIGTVRRALSEAEHTLELKRARERTLGERRAALSGILPEVNVRREGVAERKQMPRKRLPVMRRLSFFHAVFALMLLFSFSMWFGTNGVLDTANARVAALEDEVAVLQSVRDNLSDTVEAKSNEADIYTLAQTCSNTDTPVTVRGENSVEVFAVEENDGQIMALLNALAKLGVKS